MHRRRVRTARTLFSGAPLAKGRFVACGFLRPPTRDPFVSVVKHHGAT